jgi:heat shock protein HslJ
MKNSLVTILFVAFFITGCNTTQKTPIPPTPPPPPQNIELTETYWRLTELMGKPVEKDENTKREIHIVLKKEGNRVNGFSGCNNIMGQYETKEGNFIKFSNMATTMMACPDMKMEGEFNKILNAVDNYSLSGKTMTLNKARMAPMARFEAVEMK